MDLAILQVKRNMKWYTLFTKYVFVLCFFLVGSCGGDDDDGPSTLLYREQMREFVEGISEYSRQTNATFIVVPQNGIELVTENGETDGALSVSYLNAIDGNGQEDLFYGYDNDDQLSPVSETNYKRELLEVSKNNANTILVTDYCSTHSKMDDSYSKNGAAGYISLAANSRELDVIPNYPATVNNVNVTDITELSKVKNFLYLINTSGFNTKSEMINAINATNYDLIIMDLFFEDGAEFTLSEVNQLKTKSNGGSRLVLCYMSIGEAEDYRYYWQASWNTNKPDWMDGENPDWPGNYKVKYWEEGWQDIIFGNDDSYAKKILNAGFDGVYLDIIDAFEYYE